MKKWFSVALVALMILSGFPASAFGLPSDLPLDCIAFSEDMNGTGWDWNQSEKVLTLDGFSLSVVTGDYGVRVPGGTEIVLVEDSENYVGSGDGLGILAEGDLEIRGSGLLTVESYDIGIRAAGNLVLSGLYELSVSSSNRTGVRSGPGEDFPLSDRPGDLVIEDCGYVDLSGYTNGVRATGDFWIEGTVYFSAEGQNDNGARIGPGKDVESTADGNTTIVDSGQIILTARDSGLRTIGNLLIENVTSVIVNTTNHTGIRVGEGSPSNADRPVTSTNGDAVIRNIDRIDIRSSHTGIRVTGDLTIDRVSVLEIQSNNHTGIRVGKGDPEIATESDGNVNIINSGEVSITASHHGIRATGNLTVDGLTRFEVYSEATGLRIGSSYRYPDDSWNPDWSQSDAEGTVLLQDTDYVYIDGENKGIHSNGAIRIDAVGDMTAVARSESDYDSSGYGMMAGMDILVRNSALDVYGRQFGMVTGYGYRDEMNPAGGNITIDRSSVIARSNTDSGKAAVFAGDDGVIHAKIIISNAEIVTPSGAAAVDVDIDQGLVRCQAISSGPAVTLITDWNDAANRVEIEPVIRSSRGGTLPSAPPVSDEEPAEEEPAETGSKKVTLFIGRSDYTIGDDSGTMDVAPFVENGRTFVPVRFIAEAFGADVFWNQDGSVETVSIKKDGLDILITIGSPVIQVTENGAVRTVTSDVAPFVRNGRTWLPLRAIGEILGAQFDWGPKDGAIQWVSIIR